jgi:hypothetical protein
MASGCRVSVSVKPLMLQVIKRPKESTTQQGQGKPFHRIPMVGKLGFASVELQMLKHFVLALSWVVVVAHSSSFWGC